MWHYCQLNTKHPIAVWEKNLLFFFSFLCIKSKSENSYTEYGIKYLGTNYKEKEKGRAGWIVHGGQGKE